MKRNIHRVREKKRPQYSRHNFDIFSHSFVIFGMNHPDTSVETDRNHFFQFRPKPKLSHATCTETETESEHLISAETETEAETIIFGPSFQECFIYIFVAFC